MQIAVIQKRIYELRGYRAMPDFDLAEIIVIDNNSADHSIGYLAPKFPEVRFIANKENSSVYGRPVGVAFAQDGALLVSDDAGKTIWRVAKK